MIVDYNVLVNKLNSELDTKVARMKLIGSNISNVDTPGYKSKDLKFEHVMEEEMGTLQLKVTDPRHLKDQPAPALANNELVENPNPGRPDGNNVNVDEEMLKMSKNNIQYNVAVQMVAKRFGNIKDAIQKSR